MLYEIFTGRRVFEGKSFGEYVLKHMSHEPVPPSELQEAPPLPRGLERSILRCLEKRPEDRFQTVAELRSALVDSLTALETASVDAPIVRAKRRRAFYFGLSIGAFTIAVFVSVLVIWRNGGTAATVTPPRVGATLEGRSMPMLPERTQPTGPVVEQLTVTPRRIAVKFHSEPEGARVIDATGAVLGQTPLNRDLNGDGEMREYIFRHEGYRDKRMRITCDQDRTVLAVLERTSSPPAARPATDHARPDAPPRPGVKRIDEHITVDPFKEK
jgi:hypothetical protein